MFLVGRNIKIILSCHLVETTPLHLLNSTKSKNGLTIDYFNDLTTDHFPINTQPVGSVSFLLKLAHVGAPYIFLNLMIREFYQHMQRHLLYDACK